MAGRWKSYKEGDGPKAPRRAVGLFPGTGGLVEESDKEASRIVEEAKAKAKEILKRGRAEASRILESEPDLRGAEEEREKILEDARRRAEAFIKEAELERDRILKMPKGKIEELAKALVDSVIGAR